jgi:methyl-accepting chemotaxis protein
MYSIDAAIARVSEGAGAISRSVGEQVQATAEISRSITGVSQNTDLISQRIGSVGRG